MPSLRGARLFLLLVLVLPSLSYPLAAAPIRVTGRVSDEKAGLSGARLELFPAYEGYADAVRRLTERSGPVPIAKAVTDADGAFEMLAPESGCFRLVVRAERYLAEEIALLPLVEDVELPPTTLMRASPLEVRTVGPDGRPLAGIEVQALDSSPFGREFPEIRLRGWRWVRPHAVSDKEGRVSLPHFKLYGRPTIAATSPRFLGQTATGNDGGAVTLRLIPARAGWLEARGADGKPVPGALARWNGWPVGITGPDGRLEIAVPDGEPALTLESREGWQAQVVRNGEKGILPVRLEPPKRIAGRVVDSLSRGPVAGAVVWSGSPLAAPAVRSDTSGAFLIEVPAVGESWLEAGAAGFLPSERQLAKKGAAAPAIVTLAPAAALSGIVVDSGGRPVAGARITLDYMKGRQGIQVTARSRANGEFRFTGLPPGSTFDLRATRSGFARSTATARTGPAGQPSPLARIVMADGQTAFGRVVDEGGRPVEGAELILVTRMQESFEAISDDQGRFAFRHLSPGKISLRATHPGHAPGFLQGIEIPPEAPSIDLGDVKLPDGEAIEGRVTDGRGAPIASAEVKVYPEMGNFSGGLLVLRESEEEPLRTGLDGIFRAERLEGGKRYNLMVQHAGYADASLPGVQAPTTEPLRIEMKVARNLSGQVVGPEGEPVAGASLTRVEVIRRGGGGSSRTQPLGTTDADGRFRVSGAPPGPVSLQVTAEGYASRSIEGLQIPEDKDLEDVRIALSRGSVLDVRVLTAEGEPVAGAWVHASPEERIGQPGPMFLDGPGRDRTDSAGRCRLTLPEAGTYRVEAHGSGSSTWARVVAGPGSTAVELRFPAGVEVSGRVIGEDGSGTAGVSVLLEEASGRRRGAATGPDGTFILSTIPDGVYRLKATWKEFTTDSLEVTVAGSPVRGLELRLDRPAERRAILTGHLLGLAPEELPQARVNAHEKEGGEFRSTSPNREGVYRVEGLEPGEWEVNAWVSGRQAQGAVQIPAGAVEATLDLEFRKGFNLTGRVLVDGKPLPGAEVEAWGKEQPVASARTAYDGSFLVRGLAAGAVTLVVASTQGLAGSREVHVTEDQDVSIALSTGRLSGRVLAVTGGPVEDATVTVDAWIPALQTSVSAPGARTGADGAFEIPRLAAGTYKVKVSKEGFATAEATAEVPPGASAPPVEVLLKPR